MGRASDAMTREQKIRVILAFGDEEIRVRAILDLIDGAVDEAVAGTPADRHPLARWSPPTIPVGRSGHLGADIRVWWFARQKARLLYLAFAELDRRQKRDRALDLTGWRVRPRS